MNVPVPTITKLKSLFSCFFGANIDIFPFIQTQWTILIQNNFSSIDFHQKIPIHSVRSGEPISAQNVESAATPSPLSGFYLIPESDLFGCEFWICSLFYLYMGGFAQLGLNRFKRGKKCCSQLQLWLDNDKLKSFCVQFNHCKAGVW